MARIPDEDKEHSHRVVDARGRIVYARDAQQNARISSSESVPRGKLLGVQGYIDHTGTPTVVREYETRADVMTGDDQVAYFPAGPAKTKWHIVQRAEQLARMPWESVASDFRALSAEWKAAGKADRSTEEQLWRRFKTAQDLHYSKRSYTYSSNLQSKERIVSQAEGLARSSDFKAASDKMRGLMDEWKRVGPCDKADNDRLWERFQRARDSLHAAKKENYEKRQQEFLNNKRTKETLISRMQGISTFGDPQSIRSQVQAIDSQWRSVGSAGKDENDRLWALYKSTKDTVFSQLQRARETKKAEARQRLQQRVWELESRVSDARSALYRAEDSLRNALSAKSPSMSNPRWHEISSKQLQRQSNARDRVARASNRLRELESKLSDAKNRLANFY